MAILSLSSEYGTGALEIGHTIERELDYDYIPLRKILEEAGRAEKKWQRLVQNCGEDSSAIWKGSEFVRFMALVQSAILSYALKDNVIILARGSNFLLKEIPHALRVNIVAPLEKRIEMIMKKEKVNHETAGLLVKQADREIDCTIHLVYNREWNDPDAYEIKFDAGAQPIEELVEIVKNLLKAKDRLKSAEGQRLLQNRYMASKIKSAVLSHSEVIFTSLDISAAHDGISVRGIVRTREAQKSISKEVHEIAGDIPLSFELDCQRYKTELPKS